MTIWIKNLIEECKKLKFPNSTAARLTRVYAYDLIAYGLIHDHYTGYMIEIDEKKKAYPSYDDYLGGHFVYTESGTYVCDILGVKFVGKPVRLLFLKENGEVVKKIVNKEYAKLRCKNDWWYDKLNEVYTNFQFDYPSYTMYKKAPRFWRHPGDKEAYGHEFEIKFPSYDEKILFANEIKDKFRPCICEKDGSLDLGNADGPSLELITPPLGYDASHSLVSELFDLAKKYKARIPSDGYAWHVTLNLRDASNYITAGARFMYLVNHPSLRQFWEGIARRKSKVNARTGRNYCQYIDLGLEGMDLRYWGSLWAERPVNHYWATFLRQTGDAIELRICKSTLDFSVFSHTMSVIRKTWELAKSSEEICITSFLNDINTIPTKKHVRNSH